MVNKRLDLILNEIPAGIGVADVGTDHGYIPIKLCESGFSGKIYATDINQGPLNSAIAAAKRKNVENNITFICCDGLSGICSSKVDTVVIAGMGGDLICKIIDECDWIFSKKIKLILQPMTKSEILRYYLINNDISIEKEITTKDSGKIYQILVCSISKATEKYTDFDLFFGREDKQINSLIYNEYVRIKIEHIKNILNNQCNNSFQSKIYNSILEGYKHDC